MSLVCVSKCVIGRNGIVNHGRTRPWFSRPMSRARNAGTLACSGDEVFLSERTPGRESGYIIARTSIYVRTFLKTTNHKSTLCVWRTRRHSQPAKRGCSAFPCLTLRKICRAPLIQKGVVTETVYLASSFVGNGFDLIIGFVVDNLRILLLPPSTVDQINEGWRARGLAFLFFTETCPYASMASSLGENGFDSLLSSISK